MRAISKGVAMIKKNLDDNAWIFEPQSLVARVKKSEEEDPMDVSAQSRMIEAYEEETYNAFTDGASSHIQSAIRDLLSKKLLVLSE